MSGSGIERIEQKVGSEADWRRAQAAPQRQLAAMLRMWEAGYSFAELADRFHYSSPVAAQTAVEAAIAASNPQDPRSKDRLRAQLQSALMTHHRTAYTQATDPANLSQADWIKLDTFLVDRLIKLNGLDAPQVHLINPESETLQKMVELVVVHNGGGGSGEVDPFSEDYVGEDIVDAEEVDDVEAPEQPAREA